MIFDIESGTPIIEQNWQDNVYISQNRDSINEVWHPGSFNSPEDSIFKHFEKHGKEVGAADIEQYLRKAQAFSDNLKGATTSKISGSTENVTRYYKNGKYIDKTLDGKIISFGKQ